MDNPYQSPQETNHTPPPLPLLNFLQQALWLIGAACLIAASLMAVVYILRPAVVGEDLGGILLLAGIAAGLARGFVLRVLIGTKSSEVFHDHSRTRLPESDNH